MKYKDLIYLSIIGLLLILSYNNYNDRIDKLNEWKDAYAEMRVDNFNLYFEKNYYKRIAISLEPEITLYENLRD